MDSEQIKNQLQKFFDKDIVVIKKKNLYYVILDEEAFIKTVYETTINGENIINVAINPLVFDKEYELVWTVKWGKSAKIRRKNEI